MTDAELTARIETLRTSGVSRAEFHPDGSLAAVELAPAMDNPTAETEERKVHPLRRSAMALMGQEPARG